MPHLPSCRVAASALKSVAVAAILAGSATSGFAASANVSITSVTATAEAFSGNFAFVVDPYQTFSLAARDAAGLLGAADDGLTADNWQQGSNLVAQTMSASATANTIVFTDPLTQLATAGFNLAASATATGSPTLLSRNLANADGLLSGTFSLLDGAGDPAGGTLTFDVFYELDVALDAGDFDPNYGQALIALESSTDGLNLQTARFEDGLLSSADPTGTASRSGRFTWTFNLAQGDSAYFTLTGNAIASAVPEPAGYALFGAGLLALLPLVRRRLADAQRG